MVYIMSYIVKRRISVFVPDLDAISIPLCEDFPLKKMAARDKSVGIPNPDILQLVEITHSVQIVPCKRTEMSIKHTSLRNVERKDVSR